MIKSEVRHHVLEQLGSILTDAGFKLKKSQDQFVKRIPGGIQAIGIVLKDYNPQFVFTLTIEILLDPVERILHLFVNIDPKYYAEGSSTITPLSYFVQEVPPQYRPITRMTA